MCVGGVVKLVVVCVTRNSAYYGATVAVAKCVVVRMTLSCPKYKITLASIRDNNNNNNKHKLMTTNASFGVFSRKIKLCNKKNSKKKSNPKMGR